MPDSDLTKRVTELAIGVVGMKGAMEGLTRALQGDVDQVKEQLEKQRRLSKYNRRTWFQVMAYIFMVGLLVSDIGRRYCGYDGNQVEGTAGAVCNYIFWTTEHGGGGFWRVLGLLSTIVFLWWMTHRSQVPDDLYDEIAAAQVERERFRRKKKE